MIAIQTTITAFSIALVIAYFVDPGNKHFHEFQYIYTSIVYVVMLVLYLTVSILLM